MFIVKLKFKDNPTAEKLSEYADSLFYMHSNYYYIHLREVAVDTYLNQLEDTFIMAFMEVHDGEIVFGFYKCSDDHIKHFIDFLAVSTNVGELELIKYTKGIEVYGVTLTDIITE